MINSTKLWAKTSSFILSKVCVIICILRVSQGIYYLQKRVLKEYIIFAYVVALIYRSYLICATLNKINNLL